MTPWKRGIYENLCPFDQLWKTWALNNEVPVPRTQKKTDHGKI